MTFGPEMRLAYAGQGETMRIRLGSIEKSDLATLPNIDDVAETTRHISPNFRANLRDLKAGDTYYNELLTDNDARYWGIFNEADASLLGLTGYIDIKDEEGPETLTAILHPNMQGRGVGTAVGYVRTMYAFREEGHEALRSSVNIRNERSFAVVQKMGYACVRHFTKHNQERHELRLKNPLHTPDRGVTECGNSLEAAFKLSRLALKHAQKILQE